MTTSVSRRDALRHLALLSMGTLSANWVLGCKSKPSCTDVTGLTPDEVNARTSVAAYVDSSPYPDKTCLNCVQFVPAAKDACGSCKVLKGPVHPQGYCKLWTAKPA